MPVELFESVLNHVDPGFVCYDARDRSKKETYLKRVEHLANPGADAKWLKQIPQGPGADVAKAFYGRYNGALLYTARDSMGGEYAPGLGVEIFPINLWRQVTTEMVTTWAFEEYDDSQMAYGRYDFLPIAVSRGASNCVHWVIKGPRAGSIYWWPLTSPPEHDAPPLAKDFGQFITLICSEPVRVLSELLGGDWRAEEGLKEYIPSRYLPDCRQL